MTAKSTSELVCAEACWAGRAWPSDHSALLTTLRKQSSRRSPSKMRSSPPSLPPSLPPPPPPPPPTTPPHPDSHPGCFSLPYKSRGIYVLQYMHTGKPGKWRRAVEQADMSLFGQECNDKRGECGVCWTRRRSRRRRRGGEETSVSTFLSPFLPPPALSPLMAGSSQGERKEIKRKRKKKKSTDQEGMGESDLIRCRTSPLHYCR